MELTITEIAPAPTQPTIIDHLYQTIEAFPPTYVKTMFYLTLDWSDSEIDTTVVCLFEEYFEHYVLAKETGKNGLKHYQVFIIIPTLTPYNNFIAKIKYKYRLRGRATENQPRQYGKVKDKLKNPENALIYTLKEKNYRYKGFTTPYIEEMATRSYLKPDEENNLYDIMIEDIKARIYQIEEVAHQESWTRFSVGRGGSVKMRCAQIAVVESYYHHYKRLPTKSAILNLLFKIGELTPGYYLEILNL